MKNKSTSPLPRRQRRVPSVCKNAPTYFLTFCTAERAKTLANTLVFERACTFIEEGNRNTGFFASALMIMPDHIHALVSISPHSEQKIGNWVCAFKRAVGKNDIHWQNGFVDHILRNSESRSEKWEYIRNNPVRAGLTRSFAEWPYQRWFHPATGALCAPDAQAMTPAKVRPTKDKKNDLRKHVAAQRTDFQTLEKWSAAVVEKFQTLAVFQSARTVGAYMPMADEVDVSLLFQSLERQFYVPAFDAAIGSYRMAKVSKDWKTGRFGIPEPANPVFAAADEIDLILVPGVAFDRTGHRIGRGGGFYDRLLPLYRAVRAGICFEFQCLETVPAEAHDVQVDWLITESQILKVAMNS